jgi:CHLPS protein DUF818
MSEAVSMQPFPWRKEFTAKTTLFESILRLVNNLIFVGAGATVALLVCRKIQLLPPGVAYGAYFTVALAVRKIFATVIGYIAYPATTDSSRYRQELISEERNTLRALRKEGYIAEKIKLHKSGVIYDVTLVAHKDKINNGKWSIHALGNAAAIELQEVLYDIPKRNCTLGANTLLINGPAVVRSTGFPTPYQMGAGFEAGLQYLSQEVKATRIAFHGLSLGGAMMSKAVLMHQFDSKIRYFGVFDRTFSRLSDFAYELAGSIGQVFVLMVGAQLNTVSGVEKLRQLGIPHMIIQHTSHKNQGTDGTIPDRISLAANFKNSTSNQLLLSQEIKHFGLPVDIKNQRDERLMNFFNEK